jgi:hypothetical protein
MKMIIRIASIPGMEVVAEGRFGLEADIRLNEVLVDLASISSVRDCATNEQPNGHCSLPPNNHDALMIRVQQREQ